jgi:hypothetical protein
MESKQWHHERIAEYEASHPTLRVNLMIDGPTKNAAKQRIVGLEVPFSNFKVGDLADRTADVEDFLTRLLGMVVKIETGEE